MPHLKPGQILEVDVDRLSVGGRGVARSDGAVIFIEAAAPNERLQVKVSFVKKNYAEAEILNILIPSPERIKAPCPYYEKCGGCSWQHISYTEQLKQKSLLVQDCLQKFSGFKDFKVKECLGSPQEFRYRNRIQVHVQNGQLGFFKKNTHQIAAIDDCLITREEITSQFAQIRKNSGSKVQRIELKAESSSASDFDMGFSQVNSAQNENLKLLVCGLAQSLIADPECVLDLYCGDGNLSFPLAKTFRRSRVIGVELSAKNIAEAKKNHDGLRVEFHQAKVEDFLSRESADQNYDLVVLDPPRTGCDPLAMKALAMKKTKAMIYVSCHPATLARDLKFLANDYQITLVQPLDMFPQTDHVECVVGLKLKS